MYSISSCQLHANYSTCAMLISRLSLFWHTFCTAEEDDIECSSHFSPPASPSLPLRAAPRSPGWWMLGQVFGQCLRSSHKHTQLLVSPLEEIITCLCPCACSSQWWMFGGLRKLCALRYYNTCLSWTSLAICPQRVHSLLFCCSRS